MKKINIIIIGLAAVVFTGCKSLYGKYERPDVDTEGLFRDPVSLRDTLVSNDTTSFGNLPWREVFTDPHLQTIIEKALTNNIDLLNAALNVKMVEEQLKVAKLAFLPSVAVSPQGTISSFDGKAATKAYTLPVSASWNVDLFGNLLNSKRSVQMQLLATKDYQTVVQVNIISGVANLYYTLLMLDRQLEIMYDMTELTKQTWERMKLLKETRVGYRSTAVQSAEASYLSVQASTVDLKRQIREIENSLTLLMGETAFAIDRGKLEEQQLPSKFSTGVGIQLLNNRADVHAAELTLASCFYDINVARSRFYPNITITGTGAFTNNNGLVDPGKILLSAVGSLVQPIFQHGQIVAGLKVAKMKYEQAYNTWQNTILKAGNEVSNALVLYNSSEEKSQIEAKQIAVLRQNVQDTKASYGLNNTNYLEVITAQSSLLNAEISKVTDDFNKVQAVVNLYVALGGGAK
ncbi:MAG: efflux transporter outer membrane subunit [Prevotella sp.]|nr:efflux transporter outer membrane subunit [Prevotella sp.]MBQ2494838.1 efflux transporter outer membrane subunit [Prevotella sp.]MBQ2524897.1 efflux transporter outer membrane subunit [Prevotella sp.]MBQ2589385.1 efflux transporter outer membrane subunit [Prevotella sp.]MBQ4028410.1 efflux transporter outer membrane subunit [Prevotella sp.]